MTTKTLPSVRWQAPGPDGIGHAYASLRDLAAIPLCRADVHPVAERWAWPEVARCLACLNHIEYGSRQ